MREDIRRYNNTLLTLQHKYFHHIFVVSILVHIPLSMNGILPIIRLPWLHTVFDGAGRL